MEPNAVYVSLESKPNTSTVNSGSCSRINFGQRQLRRNWETGPLLCLKFSTWAVPPSHLMDSYVAEIGLHEVVGTQRLYTQPTAGVVWYSLEASFKATIKDIWIIFSVVFVLKCASTFPYQTRKAEFQVRLDVPTLRNSPTCLNSSPRDRWRLPPPSAS